MRKRLVWPQRLRKVPSGFGWVDHRLVRYGHLDRMSLSAAALYLFLATVGDAEGLSYYSENSVCRRLGLSHDDLANARAELVDLNLIAYKKPLYQVLEIATACVSPPLPAVSDSSASSAVGSGEPETFPKFARMSPEEAPMAVKDVFKKIMEGLS